LAGRDSHLRLFECNGHLVRLTSNHLARLWTLAVPDPRFNTATKHWLPTDPTGVDRRKNLALWRLIAHDKRLRRQILCDNVVCLPTTTKDTEAMALAKRAELNPFVLANDSPGFINNLSRLGLEPVF